MPLPTIRATIAAPEPLLNERSFLRLHNRAAKDALREEGLKHHKERVPQHFTRAAAGKYNHRRRKPAYMRYKARRFRSVTDLVKSGRMKQELVNTPPKIRIGGKAADESGQAGDLRLTLTMPLHVGQAAQLAHAKRAIRARRGQATRTRAATAGVDIKQMRRELAEITQDEAREIAAGFKRGYGRNLAAALARAPRIRKRVAAARAGG